MPAWKLWWQVRRDARPGCWTMGVGETGRGSGEAPAVKGVRWGTLGASKPDLSLPPTWVVVPAARAKADREGKDKGGSHTKEPQGRY